MKPFKVALVSSFVALGVWTAGCGSDKAADDDDDGGTGGGAVLGGAGGATGATGGTGGSNASGASSGGTGGAGKGGSGAAGKGGTGGAGGSQAGASATGGAAGTMVSGGSGGVPAGVGECDEACEKLIAAECGGTLAACITNCNSLTSVCPAETPPYLSCTLETTSTVMCTDGGSIVPACDAEDRAVGQCVVCKPLTTDGTCATCSRSSCCTELQSYVGATDAAAFDTCLADCTDLACVDACTAASPLAGAAYEDVGACQNDSCAEPCLCQASADDTACITCAKSNCCSELVPYALASDIEGFVTCIQPCAADQACADACIADFPVAGAAFETYSTCVLGACPTECGQ
jgi:hypothetical protein